MIFTNKSVFGFVITYADDLHLAMTAISIARRENLPEVIITEKLDGLIIKEARVKHFGSIKGLRF